MQHSCPPRILVVAACSASRDLLQRVLEGEGYRVVASADSISAHACLNVCAIDLLALDLSLPTMEDGLELCRRVRAQRALVTLPIVVCSDLDDTEWRAAALAAGANHYLLTPCPPEDLLDWLRTWLPRRVARV